MSKKIRLGASLILFLFYFAIFVGFRPDLKAVIEKIGWLLIPAGLLIAVAQIPAIYFQRRYFSDSLRAPIFLILELVTYSIGLAMFSAAFWNGKEYLYFGCINLATAICVRIGLTFFDTVPQQIIDPTPED